MSRTTLTLLVAATLLAPLAAQDPAPPAGRPQDARRGGLPPGATRESMWFPPTAEDWKRPVLVKWQRTWADALALSEATGKPLLVCVNMDGEIASEHYAGVRYRDPEAAKLYEPYVCVIASVYRHNPRDHDDQGQRIECPRFGTVTCGEHIAIEPILYEKYFEGQRVAPRHIAIHPQSGRETMDVFYAFSTQAVFDAVREGSQGYETHELPTDRSLVERVASPDAADRTLVERAYVQGPSPQRRELLEAALARGPAVPLELLRLGLLDPDPALAALARRALAQAVDEGAIDLLLLALNQPLPETEREPLLAALERLGGSAPRARTLAVAYRGLAGASTVVDGAAWGAALAAPLPDREARVARLADQDAVLASGDADARLALAEGFVALADSEPDPESARLVWLDARRTAQEAAAHGASGARLEAVLALSDWALGDMDAARGRAEAALPGLLAEASSRGSAELLALFAEGRLRAISDAVRAGRDWPPTWLSDVQATYDVLARHPWAWDRDVVLYHDFLQWFGASTEAGVVLEEGLARFPDSAWLHDRLRARLLGQGGVSALEPGYEKRLAVPGAPPALHAWAGYASLVAAEFHRRAGRPEDADAAYLRAITHYEHATETDPERAAEADHYVALALAGRARLDFERGDLDGALGQLLASFDRGPGAAATQDGLNLSPLDTGRVLLARLREQQRGEDAARLEAAIARLAPRLLEPPAYERGIPPGPPDALRPPSR